MADFRIRYARQAIDDLDAIFDYVCLENPAAAEKLLSAFDSSISRCRLPLIWALPCERINRCSSHRAIGIWSFRHIWFFIVLMDATSTSAVFCTAVRIGSLFSLASDNKPFAIQAILNRSRPHVSPVQAPAA